MAKKKTIGNTKTFKRADRKDTAAGRQHAIWGTQRPPTLAKGPSDCNGLSCALLAGHFGLVAFELVAAAETHATEESAEARLATTVQDAQQQDNTTHNAADENAQNRGDGLGQCGNGATCPIGQKKSPPVFTHTCNMSTDHGTQ